MNNKEKIKMLEEVNDNYIDALIIASKRIDKGGTKDLYDIHKLIDLNNKAINDLKKEEYKIINQIDWCFDFYIKNNMKDGVCEIPIVESMRGIGKSFYMQNKSKEDGNVYVSYRNALCTSENKINTVNLSKSHNLESVLNTTTIRDAKRLYIDEGVIYDVREIRKVNPTCEIITYKKIDR